MEILFTSVTSREEVSQMLDLQAINHVSTVSPAVAQEQGFVTVKHKPEVLQAMNEAAPSIIAKAGDQVIGYALVMPRVFAAKVPILQPMFDLLDTLSWKDKLLRDNARWFVMGQICVDEAYRGRGVFDGMYLKMRDLCKKDYDFVVTEIAERNKRSIRAHERVGFKSLYNYKDELAGEEWRVVVWDF